MKGLEETIESMNEKSKAPDILLQSHQGSESAKESLHGSKNNDFDDLKPNIPDRKSYYPSQNRMLEDSNE